MKDANTLPNNGYSQFAYYNGTESTQYYGIPFSSWNGIQFKMDREHCYIREFWGSSGYGNWRLLFSF